MGSDIEFGENITVEEAMKTILDECKVDNLGCSLYKGEEYYLCAGDCQSCSVREVLRFLLDVIK